MDILSKERFLSGLVVGEARKHSLSSLCEVGRPESMQTFPSVCPHVLLQITSLCITGVAMITWLHFYLSDVVIHHKRPHIGPAKATFTFNVND